jgi:NAD-dependent aldehyde dehydrogenases
VLYGIFSSSGEACIAGSRLFVQRSIYDAFMKRLAKALASCASAIRRVRKRRWVRSLPQRIAKPSNVTSHWVWKRAAACCAAANVRSAMAAKQAPTFQPTILEGLTNDARICQEEIFGPVLVAMPFDDEASLLKEANNSVFGLAAGIWTRDYKRAYRIARALETGTVWINTYKLFSISTPFSGWKESGMGREKGRSASANTCNRRASTGA